MKAMIELKILILATGLVSACAAPAQTPTPAPPIVQTVVVPQTVIATPVSTAAAVAQPKPTTMPPSAPAPTTQAAFQPRGLTVVNNPEPSPQTGSFFIGKLFDDRTYTNLNVSGLTFRTSWADLEPTQGNFVWAKLDTVFDNAEKNDKWVEPVLAFRIWDSRVGTAGRPNRDL